MSPIVSGGTTSSAAGVTQYDYVEGTSTITVASTNPAAPTTLIDGAAVVYDGSTRVLIEFWAESVEVAATGTVTVQLFDGSTDLGRIGLFQTIGATGASGFQEGTAACRRFLTPSAASHTYHIKTYKVGAGACAVIAGVGGADTNLPMWYRITKA